ncbi:Pao retrotransposon peptidase [Trichuris suis]|nr:Pao retrotransposon peptidase [Trichuris suis]
MPFTSSAAENTLGLIWDCRNDVFYFFFKAPLPMEPSKREMLSCIARLFDPLGLLSPVVIAAQMLVQDIWKTRCDWDEVPAEPLLTRWQHWARNLLQLDNITFPRRLCSQVDDVTAHIFCDASESAYGAVAHLRSTSRNKEATVGLAFAKVRVAPVRRLSVPRLELLAAVVAVRIARLLIRELHILKEKISFWTDSNVVLCWLSSLNKRFPSFVENRSTEILDGFLPSQWQHVAGTDNPADDLSRGLNVVALQPEHRWMVGPHFLTRPMDEWPNTVPTVEVTQSEEVHVNCFTIGEETSDAAVQAINRSSNLEGLVRTLMYVHRFVRRSRRVDTRDISGASERRGAWHACVRAVQRLCFPEEIILLQRRKQLPPKSRFRRLSPFLDTDGLIRIGGRLDEATLNYEAKHPRILPSRHALSTLLIRRAHVQNCHAGVETTLSIVRAEAWIVDARAAVRRIVGSCIICRRYRLNPSTPKVAC